VPIMRTLVGAVGRYTDGVLERTTNGAVIISTALPLAPAACEFCAAVDNI
jgi:hypothetical protein